MLEKKLFLIIACTLVIQGFCRVIVDPIVCGLYTTINRGDVMCRLDSSGVYIILERLHANYMVRTATGKFLVSKYKLRPCSVYCTISEALNHLESNTHVPPNLIINAGIYEETITITRPVTISRGIGIPSLKGAKSNCIVHLRSSGVMINGLHLTGQRMSGICVSETVQDLRLVGNIFDNIITSPISTTYQKHPSYEREVLRNWYIIGNIFKGWVNQNIYAIHFKDISNLVFSDNIIYGKYDLPHINGLSLECCTRATISNNTMMGITGTSVSVDVRVACTNPSFTLEVVGNMISKSKHPLDIHMVPEHSKKLNILLSNNKLYDTADSGDVNHRSVNTLVLCETVDASVVVRSNDMIIYHMYVSNIQSSSKSVKTLPLNLHIDILRNKMNTLVVHDICETQGRLDVHMNNINLLVTRGCGSHNIRKSCTYIWKRLYYNNILKYKDVVDPKCDDETPSPLNAVFYSSDVDVIEEEEDSGIADHNVTTYCNYGSNNFTDYNTASMNPILVNHSTVNGTENTNSSNHDPVNFLYGPIPYNTTCINGTQMLLISQCLSLDNCTGNGECVKNHNDTIACNCYPGYIGIICNTSVITTSNTTGGSNQGISELLFVAIISIILTIITLFILILLCNNLFNASGSSAFTANLDGFRPIGQGINKKK